MGFLVSRLEGGGLLSQPTLRALQAPFSVRVTLQWMDVLLAALDCYNTFTGLRLIQPQRVLGKWIELGCCLMEKAQWSQRRGEPRTVFRR